MFKTIKDSVKFFINAFKDEVEEGWMFENDEADKEFKGKVVEVLPNKFFKVKGAADNGTTYYFLCHFSGRMRRKLGNKSISAGDTVKFEISPYDLNRGRITNVFKKG